MPNMFKKGDVVKCHGTPYTVTYTDGPYVYGNGCRHYSDVTFISNPEIISLIQAGKKIEAIKAYRVITGFGLKEAKDAVEALAVSVPKFGPGDVVTNGWRSHTVDHIRWENDRYEYVYTNGEGFGLESFLTLVRRANPEPATLGDILGAALQPKGKFKIGDRVAIPSEPEDGGTVTGIESGKYSICFDSFGPGDPCYCWNDSGLIPFSHATPTIVVRFDIGKGYRPNDKPMVHNSLAEATKEAERLALANPGVKFDTFTLATSSTATAPVAGTVTTVSV